MDERVPLQARRERSRKVSRPTVGRRFFLPIGVAHPGGMFRRLPSVTSDVRRMSDAFAELGYVPGPSLTNPAATEVRATIARWLPQVVAEETDALVLYYSGHGFVSGGDHYLVTSGFDQDQAGATGLRTDELLDLVLKRKTRPAKLWLILDCCQAGGVLTEGLRRGLVGEDIGAFVLAACGSWGQAIDGAFSRAFRQVLRRPKLTGPRVGASAPSLDQLAEALNGKGLGSRVIQAGISSSRFDLLDRWPPGGGGSRRGPVADIFSRRARS